jgi:hypothetical protein
MQGFSVIVGGWGGIRTLETLTRLPVFKTGAFNHSATHPWAKELKRSPWCQLKWASAKGPATLSPISRLLRLEIIAARSIIQLSLALSTTTFPRT